MLFFVGEDAGAADFAAGAGGRRNADQRRDGAGDFVFADVVAGTAAMRENGGRDLGQVEVAAAAEAQDRVGPERPGCCDTMIDEREAGLGLAAVVFAGADAVLGERVVDAFGGADADQVLVGDDEDLAPCQPRGPQADLFDSAGAKDNPSGGFIGPGGAHYMVVGRWTLVVGRKGNFQSPGGTPWGAFRSRKLLLSLVSRS
jgi:hypothetical protein